MNELRAKILDLLRNWKENLDQAVENNGVYLFGSLVYRQGAFFKKSTSDIDLMILMPEELSGDYTKRVEWLMTLKPFKQQLEKELLHVLGKKDSTEAIVSLLPVTQFEVDHEIHKSGDKPFYGVTSFMNISTQELSKGNYLGEFKTLDDPLLDQVFCYIQKQRNSYLAVTPTVDNQNLVIDGIGDLPKDLCRQAAKINAHFIEVKETGDVYSVSFGADYIKNLVRTKINADPRIQDIYYWIDNSNELASDDQFLPEEYHLIILELLFQEATQLVLENSKTSLGKEERPPMKIADEFHEFLDNSDLLEHTHPTIKNLKVSDVLIYPNLDVFDDEREYNSTIALDSFMSSFMGMGRVLVAGEDQSGKTVLCKLLFRYLFDLGYVPVYIEDSIHGFAGSFSSKLEKAFQEQYDSEDGFAVEDSSLVIPILDNFHYARNKKKLLDAVRKFTHHLITVDDVFELNFGHELLIKSYEHHKIRELSATQRYDLITKWVDKAYEHKFSVGADNDRYAQIDEFVELVETSLGKVIGAGIMPSYPFFVLSIISTYEVASSSLKQEITSQGHCYYALIYLYLRKQGVKDEHIDPYLNFLTELAKFTYDQKSQEIAQDKFESFVEEYQTRFLIPMGIKELLRVLEATTIIKKNSLGNYYFKYYYVYYYFAGKYFAENIGDEQSEIEEVFQNLHTNDNAYIAVFISHHSKNPILLKLLLEISESLFDKYEPATLSKDELGFFDERINTIAQAVLPSPTDNPELERKDRLRRNEEALEVRSIIEEQETELDELSREFSRNLRRAVKTVEVIGRIIKNRHGSITIPELQVVFLKGMNVHLRILKSFIELISNPSAESELVEFLGERIRLITAETENEYDREKIVALAKEVFWNNNFSVIYAFTQKIIHSLGSKELIPISSAIASEVQSPSARLVEHGCIMWYGKQVRVDEIKQVMSDKSFSRTAASVMNFQIVNHSRMHRINYKDLQKIETQLHIPANKLLVEHNKAR